MNDNQKNILIKFLIWATILFLLIFIGVNNIFALETKTLYSTNSSGTLSNSNKYTYGYINQGGVQTVSTASVNTTVNGRALALIYYMYEPIVLNKTYTMVVNFMSTDLINTFTSNMVQVATCNGDVCNDNTIVSVTKSNPSGWSNKLTIEFNPVTSGSILFINLSDKNATRLITGETTFGIKSVTLDSTNQNQEIIDNQTNNTNNIINNNNSNTQEIIDSSSSNAQDIINNQNSNASAIQDTINSNFQDCHTSVNLLNLPNGTVTNRGITGTITNGNVLEFSGTAITSYADITSNASVTLPAGTYTFSIDEELTNRVVLYASGDNYSSNIIIYAGTKSTTRTFTSDITVYRVGISGLTSGSTYSSTIKMQLQEGSTATDYEPYGEQICANKLDEAEKTRKGILGKLGELISNLFSNDDADISGLNNMVGWLPPGPVDSIINLPLNLFNALTNVLSGTCQGVTLTLPFVNQTLTLPCFDSFMSQNLTGFSTFWTWLGVTMSVFILYRYLLTLYAWIDNTLTMRENNLPGYYDENMWGGA